MEKEISKSKEALVKRTKNMINKVEKTAAFVTAVESLRQQADMTEDKFEKGKRRLMRVHGISMPRLPKM